MNNATKSLAPPVEISLPADLKDGELIYQTFKLAYDFNAICAIKVATGKSIINSEVWEKIEDDPELLSVVLWGGLHLYHPALSIEQVRSMMLGGDWVAVLNKVVEAWKAARPKPRPVDPKPELTAEPASVQMT